MNKDVGLNIRIDSELRDRFRAICREQDRPAAQVLRELMRDYIAAYDVKVGGGAKKRLRARE